MTAHEPILRCHKHIVSRASLILRYRIKAAEAALQAKGLRCCETGTKVNHAGYFRFALALLRLFTRPLPMFERDEAEGKQKATAKATRLERAFCFGLVRLEKI